MGYLHMVNLHVLFAWKTQKFTSKFSGKVMWLDSHRWFLSYHLFRRNKKKKLVNGDIESRGPPLKLILEQV